MRSEYSRHTEVNMTQQKGKFPPCCVPALLVMPTWKINVARRVIALPVTPKWEIDMARMDPALLVTPKWKMDMARGTVALLFTSGYQHGKEGHSPPCYAETGCR